MKKAFTSGFLRRYEKFPGFGLENDKVRDLAGGTVDDSGGGAAGGAAFENLRSEFLVKKRTGPELQGALGASGGSHWHGARFGSEGT